MPEEIKHEITRVEPAALAVELTAAWRALRAETPKRGSILVLMAQSAHETGHWKKGCHCWNLGNIKSVPGDGRDWTFFRCHEIENGQKVWYDPPHPATRFRAFRTLREGALDHLAFLMKSKRYAGAWPHVMEPDPVAFVHALKKGGYFTDDPAIVARSVASIYKSFVRALPFEPAPVDPELDEETKERVRGRVALSLHELAGAALDDQRWPSKPPPAGGAA